jgi:magnesium chelatase family protein
LIIQTIAQIGFVDSVITIESDIRRGIFRFDIIGLADKTIEESKLRVLAALRNSKSLENTRLNHKILILLSPASIKKEGTHFDLPIAIECLKSLGRIRIPLAHAHETWAIFGELGLYGEIKSVSRIKKLIEHASKFLIKYIIAPRVDLPILENLDIEDVEIYLVETLEETVRILCDDTFRKQHLKEKISRHDSLQTKNCSFLLDSIVGKESCKEALVVALAGKHHIVFTGTPGTGKSMLAQSARELLHHLYPSAGFRDPHHTCSYTELLGSKDRPGEVHHADKGVLFLDELSEFNRRSLETLRQSLENGYTSMQTHTDIADSQKNPADYLLIGTSNLCKCGNFGSEKKRCTCQTHSVKQYQARISGAISNRISIFCSTNEEDLEVLDQDVQRNIWTSAHAIKNIRKVRIAQEIRKNTILKDGGIFFFKQSSMGPAQNTQNFDKKKIQTLLYQHALRHLDTKEEDECLQILHSSGVSKRELESIVLVAQTLADIEDSPVIFKRYLLKSLGYKKRFTLL